MASSMPWTFKSGDELAWTGAFEIIATAASASATPSVVTVPKSPSRRAVAITVLPTPPPTFLRWVSVSSLPASSVKLTRTLMTLPLSDDWTV